ncbi:MAG: hypothetical protein RR603_03280, partial [Kurthia sp.]
MQFIKEENLQSVSTEFLIVGVSQHQENLSEWSNFTAVYGDQVNQWMKDEDIQVKLKGLTKVPTTSTSVKRIL